MDVGGEKYFPLIVINKVILDSIQKDILKRINQMRINDDDNDEYDFYNTDITLSDCMKIVTESINEINKI